MLKINCDLLKECCEIDDYKDECEIKNNNDLESKNSLNENFNELGMEIVNIEKTDDYNLKINYAPLIRAVELNLSEE